MAIGWKELGNDWLVEDPAMALGWLDGERQEILEHRQQINEYLQMQLAVAGLAVPPNDHTNQVTSGFLSTLREKNRMLSTHRPAIDRRVEEFLQEHFDDVDLESPLQLPSRPFVLDRHGMAR